MKRTAVIVAIIALGFGCAPFHPEFFLEARNPAKTEGALPESAPASTPQSGEVAASMPAAPETRPTSGPTVLSVRGLQKKLTVAVEGEISGGRMRAERLVAKPSDREIEVKATLEGVEVEQQRIDVGGIVLAVTSETKILEDRAGELTLDELRRGDWVKVEAVKRGEELEIRKITRRTRKEGEADKIAGEIDSIEKKKNRFTVGGIRVDYDPLADLVWEAKDSPPESAARDAKRPAGAHPSIQRVRRIDSDNSRPDNQFNIDDVMTIGGELRYDFEWRNNYDLRDDLERDRAVQTASATLEVSTALSQKAAGFVSLYTSREGVITDEAGSLDLGWTMKLYEGFVVFDDFPVKGFGLQMGRQNYSIGRKWIYDKNLDAFRLWFNTDAGVVLEASIATVLWDADTGDKKVVDTMFGAHFEPIADQKFFAWLIHRENGQMIDYDRTHVGLEVEGEIGAFQYWFDGAYEWGHQMDNRVNAFLYEYNERLAGWGVDFAGMYVFEDLPLEPSLIGGVAYGSGDKDPYDGSDGNFQQTGLQRNRADYNGVASFNYYGDLTNFDLSNLIVTTGGIGFRPMSRTSIDFVHHHYWQVDGSRSLAPSRLRMSPTGSDTDIGDEFDLILGLKYFAPFSARIIAAYFHPGDAFRQSSGGPADDAWWLAITLKTTF